MLPLVKKLGAKKMEKEKLEVESSEEDDKVLPEKEEVKSEEEGTKVAEEEKEKSEDEFEKKEEFVSTNKFNQAVRKQRELELEKRELEKRLAEKGSDAVAEKEKPAPKKEEDSFFEDIEGEEKVEKETPSALDASKMLDEKLKPILERIDKKEKEDRVKTRTAFFEANPQYRDDSEEWNSLLEILDKYISPNSGEYFEQLNAAHLIKTGQGSEDTEVVAKKKEMASEAASGGSGAIKATAKEEFTPEDRKYMKEWSISEEGMKAYKEKTKSGAMRILT